MARVEGSIHPGRVLEALAASGYSPESAIADIVDNSVTWGARTITVALERYAQLAANHDNNAVSYVIMDDAAGMALERLEEALALGSVIEYPQNSLSLFGLGLKAAGFSQGRVLQVCTRAVGGDLLLAEVDLDAIEESGDYFFDLKTPFTAPSWAWTLADEASHGTVVRLSRIRSENQPSVASTYEALAKQLGLIYRYFLSSGLMMNLEMHADGEVLESREITGFDPLFSDEATASEGYWTDGRSPITKGSWDGLSVEWLRKPTPLVLDPLAGVVGTLAVTQLPHPPSAGAEARAGVREAYGIEAGAYGVYVYRNQRLIVAAEKFDGLVTQSKELYGLRVELSIDETADAALNIDLKKSRILLNQAARNVLDDELSEARRASRTAWRARTAAVRAAANVDPDSQTNDLLSDVDLPSSLPTDPLDAASEAARADRNESDTAVPAVPAGRRVAFVPHLDDNVVWERALDPLHGVAVRINEGHRFIRDMRTNFEDVRTAVVLQSMLLALANAEHYMNRSFLDISAAKLESVLSAHKLAVSASLASIAREISADLSDLTDGED